MASASRRDFVKILVLGDDGVGKTSVISTLIAEMFPEQVDSVMEEVILPADEMAENINVSIVDTSSDPSDREYVLSLVQQADVVMLIYAVDRMETFERINSYWMPRISRQGPHVPVVLVGNKLDLRAERDTVSDPSRDLQQRVQHILDRFPMLETFVECSARSDLNIREAFYFAQKCVLYPLRPLFNVREKSLSPAFASALLRVFTVFDGDRDGVLSDAELALFQRQLFATALTDANLDDIYDVLRDDDATAVAPCHAGRGQGLSLRGFRLLCQLFIERNRTDTPWAVLRQFGYDDAVQLRPPVIPPRSLRRDQTPELSAEALAFLSALFEQFTMQLGPMQVETALLAAQSATAATAASAALGSSSSRRRSRRGRAGNGAGNGNGSGAVADTAAAAAAIESGGAVYDVIPLADADGDGGDGSSSKGSSGSHCLSASDTAFLWQLMRDGQAPWRSVADYPACTLTDAGSGLVTLPGWLAMWNLSLTRDLSLTLDALYCCGYITPLQSAYTVPASRRAERRRGRIRRTLFNCLLIGDSGCGKTTFASVHATNKPFVPVTSLTKQPSAAAVAAAAAAAQGPAADESGRRHFCTAARTEDNQLRYLTLTEWPSEDTLVGGRFSQEKEGEESKGGKEGSGEEGEAGTPQLSSALAAALHTTDVVCLLFDAGSAPSLQFAITVQSLLPSHLPVLFLATKSDMLEAQITAAASSAAAAAAASLAGQGSGEETEDGGAETDGYTDEAMAVGAVPGGSGSSTEEGGVGESDFAEEDEDDEGRVVVDAATAAADAATTKLRRVLSAAAEHCRFYNLPRPESTITLARPRFPPSAILRVAMDPDLARPLTDRQKVRRGWMASAASVAKWTAALALLAGTVVAVRYRQQLADAANAAIARFREGQQQQRQLRV